MKASHRTALGLSLLLAATGLAYRRALGFELLGWDSWPLVASSRLDTAGGALGLLGRELMGGRYPGGHFYRPLLSASFALDWACHGMDARGYQLTNLLALAGATLAVFALGRRLLGRGPGAWIAAAVFALHPLEVEVVPVASRRADLLAALFGTAAVRASLGRGPLTAPLLAALCTALATASKETGAAALAPIAAAAFLLPASGDGRSRLLATLRATAAPAGALAALVAARIRVLGGLGGHPESSLSAGWLRGILRLPDYARSLLEPQPLGATPAQSELVFASLAAAAIAAIALVARDARADPRAPSPARALGVLAAWAAALLALFGVSGVRASWYAVALLPPYALALGALAEGARAAFRAGRRPAALVAAALVMLLVATHLRDSSLVHRYVEWEQVSAQERAFLAELGRRVEAAEPGTTLAVDGLPLGLAAPIDQRGIRSALGMSDYGAQAWAELRYPGRRIRVVRHDGGAPTPPTPGVVTIDALPLPGPGLDATP